MRENSGSHARAAPLTLALLSFVGCGDSTGPAPDVDTAATQIAFEQVIDLYFNDNPGLNSLEIFGADIGDKLQPDSPVNFAIHPEPSQQVGLTGRLGQSMRVAFAHGTSLPVLMASIPADSLGTTFEYDTVGSRYVASVRTGAPADGVRFILYDSKTALNEVGHIDFGGESILDETAAPIDLTLQAFITAASPTMPVLDYHATGTTSETGGDLSFSGFLSDGSSQLDFDLAISGSDAAVRSAGLALSADELTVSLDISRETTDSQTLEASIGAGWGEIRFLVESDENGDIQDGSGIFLDDGSGEVLVATFMGSIGQAIQLTNAEGDPLTQQELLALANILTAMEYALVLMEDLFGVGLTLVGISFFF